jgi:hypothetical protein
MVDVTVDVAATDNGFVVAAVVITIVAVLVFLCHCLNFQRIYEKVKQALLNFKDIAAYVAVVVSGALVIVDVTVVIFTTDNVFVVAPVVITCVVVLVLLQHRLHFRKIYEKASSN